MKCIACIASFIVFSLGEQSFAQTENPEQSLERANQLFQSAVAEAEDSPESAQTTFALAAAHYQALIDEQGIENASLLLNLGNSRLLSGDTGRAILSFRRAERLAPGDADVATALGLARSAVGVAVSPSLTDRSVSLLSKSLTVVGRRTLLFIVIGCWIAGWAICVLNRARDTKLHLVPVPVLFVIAILGASWLSAELIFVTHAREGVVVWEQVEGRSGPGVGVYDETFDQPLPSGLELTIVSVRDDWLQAKLADGRVTWLPKNSVEEI